MVAIKDVEKMKEGYGMQTKRCTEEFRHFKNYELTWEVQQRKRGRVR